MSKIVIAHKNDWDEKLFFTIHSYKIKFKTTMGRTLYYLVNGQEPIWAIKMEIEMLRVMGYPTARLDVNLKAHLKSIDKLEEVQDGSLEQKKRT